MEEQAGLTPAYEAARATDAGKAATEPAAAGLKRLRMIAGAAIAVSIVSLVVAVTVPLWYSALHAKQESARLLALAVAQLRPLLADDHPFAIELSVVRKLAPADDPGLSDGLVAVAAFAGRGVATEAQLRDRLVRLANDVTVSGMVNPAPGWLDRAVVTVASSIELNTIAHRLNDPRETTGIMWDARVHMDAGDLAGAVAVLEKLAGKPAETAQPWIADARARLAADHTLALLDKLSDRILAAEGAPPPGK